jgi:L-asparaginase/N4-(beta-N-acetylglucosaminyl)-L-asparaginase
MIDRRKFLQKTLLLSLFMGMKNALPALPFAHPRRHKAGSQKREPVVLSTWDFGLAANLAALNTLDKNGSCLDAVEQGVRVIEADPAVTSVGYGGYPDREGKVTLDACIMDAQGNCGGVACLEDIMHPISVARRVMEDTPHVLIVGEGARKFALEKGFRAQNLLTAQAKKAWEDWKKESVYKTEINRERHDTIGLLALDAEGTLAGACTTSGMSFKMRGRVGDSPIIGAGLYVDGEVGAATTSGLGEAVIKSAGSFLIVELMRHGRSPQEACEEAVRRIVAKQKNYMDFQVGYLALSAAGEVGAYSIHPGFTYTVSRGGKHEVFESKSYIVKQN